MKQGMREGSHEDTGPTEVVPEASRIPQNMVGWSRQRSVARRRGVQSCLSFLSNAGTFSSLQRCQLFAPSQAADADRITPPR